MEDLANVSLLLFMFAVVVLSLGLAYPPLIVFITRSRRSRKWIGKYIGLTCIVLFVVAGVLIHKYVPAPSSKHTQTGAKPVRPTPTEATGHLPLTKDEIQLQQAIDDAGGGTLDAKITYFDYYMQIANNEQVKWELCDVTIGYETSGDQYYADFGEMLPHQTIQLPWSEITREDGRRFDFSQVEPRNVHLACTVNGKQRSATF